MRLLFYFILKYYCSTKKFYITIWVSNKKKKGFNMTFRNILEIISESFELFFTTIEYMMLKLNERVL